MRFYQADLQSERADLGTERAGQRPEIVSFKRIVPIQILREAGGGDGRWRKICNFALYSTGSSPESQYKILQDAFFHSF